MPSLKKTKKGNKRCNGGEKQQQKNTSIQGRYGNRLSTSWLLLRGTGFSSTVACRGACVCVCVKRMVKKKSERKMQIQTV